MRTEPRPRVFMTTDAVGGVWTYSLAIAAGFLSRGWDVTLAVPGPKPDVRRLAEAAAAVPGMVIHATDLPLDWTADGEGTLAAAARDLEEMAVAAGADTAHLHAPALAALPWRMPVVTVAHSCVGTWWVVVRGGRGQARG